MNYRTLLPAYLIQLQDPEDLQFGSFIFEQQQGLRRGGHVRKVCWNVTNNVITVHLVQWPLKKKQTNKQKTVEMKMRVPENFRVRYIPT